MRASELILQTPNGTKRGYAAELMAAVYLMGQGWDVAFAAAGCAFDLLAVKDGVAKTIQVKLSWNKDSSNPLVSLSTKHPYRGKHSYGNNAFDVYCFVIPNDEDGSIDVCFWPFDNGEMRQNMRISDEVRAMVTL